jgi:16S rRNA (uracil1498-N3)-methyltransferase
VSATLLVVPEELELGRVEVRDEAYRHLFRARRLQRGDGLRVVDGEGRARRGRVVEVDRSRGVVELGEVLPSLESELEVELWVSALRPERASWLVEKATELGVTRVVWLSSERTGRHYGEGTLARQRRVARAAVEQCGRARMPEVVGPRSWQELGAVCRSGDVLWMLDVAAGGGTPALPEGRLRIAIGPEGGWSDEERDRLEGLGARAIQLGPRVLRVETAALAAAAIALCQRPSR